MLEYLYDDVAEYITNFLDLLDIIALTKVSSNTYSLFAKYIKVDFRRKTISYLEAPIITNCCFMSHDLSRDQIFWFDGKPTLVSKLENKLICVKPSNYRINYIGNIVIDSPDFKLLYMNGNCNNSNMRFILYTPNIEYIFTKSDKSYSGKKINTYNSIDLRSSADNLKTLVCDNLYFTSRVGTYNSVKYLVTSCKEELDDFLYRFPNIVKASIKIAFNDLINYNREKRFNKLTHLQIYFDDVTPDPIENPLINKALRNIKLLCPNLKEFNYNPNSKTYKHVRKVFGVNSRWYYKTVKYLVSRGIIFTSTEYMPWEDDQLPKPIKN